MTSGRAHLHSRQLSAPPSTPADAAHQSTADRILAAAVTSLREEGFAGTSARSIARHGGFNQALIFYHFGSVLDLLITTLERVSAERLDEYRSAVDEARDFGNALSIARHQYEIDVRDGHITVLAELVAGASAVPELGPEIVRCMEPWTQFAESSIHRFLDGTLIGPLLPAPQAARALVAMYLGMELLDHLDPASDTASQLFQVAEQLYEAVQPLLGDARAHPRAKRRRPRRIHVEGEASTSAAKRR